MANAYTFKIDPADPYIEFPVLVNRTCCIAGIDFELRSITASDGSSVDPDAFTMVESRGSTTEITTYTLSGERGTVYFLYDDTKVSLDPVTYTFLFNASVDCKGDGNVISENFGPKATFTGIGTDGPCTPGPYYMNFNFGYKNGRFSEDMVVTPTGNITITGASVGSKLEKVTIYSNPTAPGVVLYENGNINPAALQTYNLTNKTLTVEVEDYTVDPVPPSQTTSMSQMIGYALQIEYN